MAWISYVNLKEAFLKVRHSPLLCKSCIITGAYRTNEFKFQSRPYLRPFFGGPVNLITKLQKILNEGNLTLSLLFWNYWNSTLNGEFTTLLRIACVLDGMPLLNGMVVMLYIYVWEAHSSVFHKALPTDFPQSLQESAWTMLSKQATSVTFQSSSIITLFNNAVRNPV
jgi:hypothetical protein